MLALYFYQLLLLLPLPPLLLSCESSRELKTDRQTAARRSDDEASLSCLTSRGVCSVQRHTRSKQSTEEDFRRGDPETRHYSAITTIAINLYLCALFSTRSTLLVPGGYHHHHHHNLNTVFSFSSSNHHHQHQHQQLPFDCTRRCRILPSFHW